MLSFCVVDSVGFSTYGFVYAKLFSPTKRNSCCDDGPLRSVMWPWHLGTHVRLGLFRGTTFGAEYLYIYKESLPSSLMGYALVWLFQPRSCIFLAGSADGFSVFSVGANKQLWVPGGTEGCGIFVSADLVPAEKGAMLCTKVRT